MVQWPSNNMAILMDNLSFVSITKSLPLVPSIEISIIVKYLVKLKEAKLKYGGKVKENLKYQQMQQTKMALKQPLYSYRTVT